MIGQTIAHYTITEKIGQGGMGEVYRATDSKLSREVALKILPKAFAGDPQRMARFRREAKVLAALSHSNIGAIYGLEDSAATQALVLELIEGDTLAQRITQGKIPMEEALRIALQMAAALEAAHEKGIIHRDLKPANVKITPEGQVKVLDFGLAKAFEEDRSSEEMAHSPTLSMQATEMGIILGTAAYMSPEQAKGTAADHRADIFSFGVVLYEMLTGRTPFQGETISDVLASVLAREPDMGALDTGISPRLAELVRRCLEKSPKHRWQAIGDTRYELERIVADPMDHQGPFVSSPSLWRRIFPLAAAAVGGAVLFGAFSGLGSWRTLPPSAPVIRMSLARASPDSMAVAPEGDRIAFVVPGQSQGRNIMLRSFSSFEPTSLVESASFIDHLVFSPDGRWIAFTENSRSAGPALKRVPVEGGIPTEIARFDVPVMGLSWSGEDLLAALPSLGIFRVKAAGGGSPEQIVALQADEHVASPQLLPEGDTVLFTLANGPTGDWSSARVVIQSLESNQRDVVVPSGSDGRYLASGHIIYFSSGILFAVPFDVQERRVLGAPTPVIDGVRRHTLRGELEARGLVSVSNTGTLAYVPGHPSFSGFQRELVLVERSGSERRLDLPLMPYESPRISPDGGQLAVSTSDDREDVVWVYDLSGQTALRRLTFTGRNRLPVWSPDSSRLAFQSDREGTPSIFLQSADGMGRAEALTKAEPDTTHIPESWSRDGQFLSFSVLKGSNAALWLYSLTDGRAVPFRDVRSSNPLNSAFSPDGKWIAYTVRAGREAGQIFLEPVPPTGALYQVSQSDGAHHPFWAPDGEEIFYISGPLWSSPIDLSGSVAVGKAVRIDEVDIARAGHTGQGPLNFDLTPDGRQFVLPRRVGATEWEESAEESGIRVVLNWFEELKTKVAVGN